MGMPVLAGVLQVVALGAGIFFLVRVVSMKQTGPRARAKLMLTASAFSLFFIGLVGWKEHSGLEVLLACGAILMQIFAGVIAMREDLPARDS